jgi:hypothetical protein
MMKANTSNKTTLVQKLTARISATSAIAGSTLLVLVWAGGGWLQSRNIPENIRFEANDQELVRVNLPKEDITRWIMPLIALGGIGMGLGAGFELGLLAALSPKRKLKSSVSVDCERLFADAYIGATTNEARDFYLWSLLDKRPSNPLEMNRAYRLKAIKLLAALGYFPYTYQLINSIQWMESREYQKEVLPQDLSELRNIRDEFLSLPSDLPLEKIARKRGTSYDGSLADRMSVLCFLQREGLLTDEQFDNQQAWAMQRTTSTVAA